MTLTDILHSLERPAAVRIMIIAGVTWAVIALLEKCIPWLANKFSGRNRLYVLALAPLLRLGLIVAAGFLIFSTLVEPTLENVLILLGAVGLALGVAFKDYLSSLVAGIVTLYENPYQPGDWIEVEAAYGEVRSVGMRTIKIVTPDDTTVTIPHLKLWTTLFFNANAGSRNLLCVADFYLYPHHDAVQVERVLRDVALTSPFLQIPTPVTVTVQEKPWGTHYRLKAYPVEPRDQFRFRTDLTIRGKEALTQLGVTYASFLLSPEHAKGLV
jgi:small-conductance mechanosensitive channel